MLSMPGTNRAADVTDFAKHFIIYTVNHAIRNDPGANSESQN